MKRLIIFLIRRRLGLKAFEPFKFSNQKSTDIYFFTDDELVKIVYEDDGKTYNCRSGVSLNWLLDNECEITKGV